MDQAHAREGAPAVAGAQRLRLNRILGGCLSFACTGAVVVASWASGYVGGTEVAHFFAGVVAINGIAIALVLSGLNLRLRDPSLTGPIIVASLGPSAYVMYHVGEPMVRAAFLMMATAPMLFAALAFDFRAMLRFGGLALLIYLLVLLALQSWAPQRLDVQVETIIIVAYGGMLAQTAFLGSLVAGLREKLREKNASLKQAMVKLEELATRDPLTRLPNRRTAMQQLDRELSRKERRQNGGEGLCLGLLDIDHFKRINDRYGHQTGDAVLRKLGDTLNEIMRQGDFVARFGGEEFLIILPETGLEGGERAADRMRKAIARMPLDDLPLTEPVTVSIGIAAHDLSRRIEETLALADGALYDAKHLGRDKVVVHRERAAGAASR